MNIDKLKEMGFNLIPLKPKSKEPIGGLNWKQFQDNKYMGSHLQTRKWMTKGEDILI